MPQRGGHGIFPRLFQVSCLFEVPASSIAHEIASGAFSVPTGFAGTDDGDFDVTIDLCLGI